MLGLLDTPIPPSPRRPDAQTRRAGSQLSRRDAGVEEPGSIGVTSTGPGLYLTDEVFLYRLVELVATPQEDVVRLEDCYLLDVVEIPISHVRKRRLRVVIPMRVDDRDPLSLTLPGPEFE